jgi:hypothetical protein
MKEQVDFVLNAIEDANETNRFLETKAGVLIAFETSFLAIAAYSLFDKSALELIQALVSGVASWFLVLLAVYFVGFLVALVMHILFTLRVIMPQEAPEAHVHLGDFEPKRLFFLFKLDQDQKLGPSVTEYSQQLAAMSEAEITSEYVFELLKVSYIRKAKSDRLNASFRYLRYQIIGIVVFAILVALGMFLF